ncbi:MAG: hypothetical protein OER86_00060, partial [Phycisphaerae bacterium]|nr:hypothetical protein [Phycisphaerae bacterium]
EGIRLGRAYVGDGRSHLIDFTVGDVELGTKDSELRLEKPGTVPVRARVAAYLPVQADPALAARSYTQKPYWHVERARVPGTRKVKVELVVNGRAVGEKAIEADGELREVRFDVPIQASSWVAMRILATSHTNPVFVTVAGKPIRASRRSAQWCLAGVDRCWSQKKRFIGAAEMDDAEKAYAHARQAYRRILSETTVD